MGYNVLSGSTSVTHRISVSGAFIGDGSQLENVTQFELQNEAASLIPFYKTINGELGLNANSGFSFNNSNNRLTVPNLTSSVGIRLASPTSGTLAGIGSYLGVTTDGDIILTSSAAGTGPANSLQFHTTGGKISGSANLTFSSNVLTLPALSSSVGINLSNPVSGTLAGTGSYLGLDSNNNIVLTSSLGGGGTISYSRRAITAHATASVNDTLIGVSASTAPIDIRLPPANVYVDGQYFVIKDEAGNANLFNITIKASGSQTIDGVLSIVLESPFASVSLYSNGINKFFIY